MLRESEFYCPECDNGLDGYHPPSRRDFLGVVGAGAALAASGLPAFAAAADKEKREAKPAEAIIRELYSSLSADQKKELVYEFDHPRDDKLPARLGTYNSAAFGKRLANSYTKPQQDLVKQALRAILSSDDALERLSRHGKWDGSGSFEGCGAVTFGDPTGDGPFAWLFTGHHLTFRCDGNSQPGAAFGGPMFYGHSAGGYSENNVYLYQTKQVQSVFDALDEKQRDKAVAAGDPGDREAGIKFRPDGEPHPGISYADLTGDQRELVAKVMRTLLNPFRKEDGDEVMELIKANGGMEQLHLAFYSDRGRESGKWHYWRLEGPGFIWNFRVLPHVHCYVNIVAA